MTLPINSPKKTNSIQKRRSKMKLTSSHALHLIGRGDNIFVVSVYEISFQQITRANYQAHLFILTVKHFLIHTFNAEPHIH